MSVAANKKSVTKREVPLTMQMRRYPVHERFTIVAKSILHEGESDEDVMDYLLREIQRRLHRIPNQQHRLNVANELRTMSAGMRRDMIRIVHQKPILVTHYPTNETEAT